MDFLLWPFVFVFGLCVGSFLNVVIVRLQTGETLGGRSHCPRCRHRLAWIDLVPVISFLVLYGACRYCKTKISLQYPLVELSTGLIFLFIFVFFASHMLFWFYIASSLIVIFVYDLKHFIIPDKILFPAIMIAFLFDIANDPFMITSYFTAAALASGFFLVIYIVSRGRWIGFGDVKLAILLGLLLGWPAIITGLFLAFWLGAIAGIILMVAHRGKLKTQMPFAPFLIMGTCGALIWGSTIMRWYLSFF